MTNEATATKMMSTTISKTDKTTGISSKLYQQTSNQPIPQAYAGPKIVVTKGGR